MVARMSSGIGTPRARPIALAASGLLVRNFSIDTAPSMFLDLGEIANQPAGMMFVPGWEPAPPDGNVPRLKVSFVRLCIDGRPREVAVPVYAALPTVTGSFWNPVAAAVRAIGTAAPLPRRSCHSCSQAAM